MISAERALQVILILLTIWTAFSGLALIFFPASAEASIGGDQSEAAQRLLGVHVLVVAVIYGLLAWRREQYQVLLWVPFVVQSAVVVITLVNMVTGDSDFTDGVLPLVVAATFLALLVFVWRSGQLEIFPGTDLLSRFTDDRSPEQHVIELPAVEVADGSPPAEEAGESPAADQRDDPEES